MNKTVTENDSGSEAETVKPYMKIDEEMLKKLSQEISQQVKRNLNVNEQKIMSQYDSILVIKFFLIAITHLRSSKKKEHR